MRIGTFPPPTDRVKLDKLRPPAAPVERPSITDSADIGSPSPRSWKQAALTAGLTLSGLIGAGAAIPVMAAAQVEATGQQQTAAVVYNSRYGYQAIGRIDGGTLYDSQYGFQAIGRFEDGVVYDSQYGYNAIGRVDSDGVVYNSRYGYDAVGRVEEDGTIYNSRYGYTAVGRAEGGDDSRIETVERGGAALRLLLKPDA